MYTCNMSRVQDARYTHHKYKDRGQGLSIRLDHRKYMDHTRSIHTCIMHTYILLLELSFPSVRSSVRLSLFVTCITHTCIIHTCLICTCILHTCIMCTCIMQTCWYASCIPTSCMHASCIHAPCIHELCIPASCIYSIAIHTSCIHASCVHASCIHLHTYIHHAYLHHSYMHIVSCIYGAGINDAWIYFITPRIIATHILLLESPCSLVRDKISAAS